ncbi:MAG: histidine phosphatase family protein [Oscillospiraceae bacterium]
MREVIGIKIYLIRHGETDWNVAGKLQGREDIPLNKDGIEQAHVCGRALSGIEVTGILSSPLERARDTAKIIAGHIGYKGGVAVDYELTERDYGELSGKTPQDIFRPEEGTPGLEPLEDVIKRFKTAVINNAGEHSGDIIIVSHGASINALLKDVSGGEVGSGKTTLKNAGISILDFKHGELKLEDFNLSADEYIMKFKLNT